MAELVEVKRSILIGSLSGPNFAIRTTETDRSRTDTTGLCSWKDIQKQTFSDSKFCKTSVKMA